MTRQVVSIANRQRLDVNVSGPNGANRLLIYTGIAILDERFAIDNMLVRAEVDIILGPNNIADPNIGDNFSGSVFSSINAVASVALAANFDLENSDNVGWAVDEATIEEMFIDPATKFLKIHTKIAFQGEFTNLARISYHADVLAIAAEGEVQLRSLTLVPERIHSRLNGIKGISQATLTLDKPAPAGGIVVKISAKSSIPTIVSFPGNITIGAGQSTTMFDVTAADEIFSIEEVLIMATYGPHGALAAKLFVIGG